MGDAAVQLPPHVIAAAAAAAAAAIDCCVAESCSSTAERWRVRFTRTIDPYAVPTDHCKAALPSNATHATQ